ncbi:MAG: GYD domain-containing protein [Betaproteobacteria bacterium]|nr:GYD domain-containing protein [Betaproteobacteria bacterium]
MATFVSLVSFTDQGIRNVKDSPARFDGFRAAAEKLGVTVKSVYWTVGSCDIVVTVDGPEDKVTALLLKVGSLGNVRSQTLRAYGEDEFRRILAAMP